MRKENRFQKGVYALESCHLLLYRSFNGVLIFVKYFCASFMHFLARDVSSKLWPKENTWKNNNLAACRCIREKIPYTRTPPFAETCILLHATHAHFNRTHSRPLTHPHPHPEIAHTPIWYNLREWMISARHCWGAKKIITRCNRLYKSATGRGRTIRHTESLLFSWIIDASASGNLFKPDRCC